MRLVCAFALLATVLAWQRPAEAGDPAIAREQLKIGYELAQQGHCDQALPHLVESLRLDAKAITLINLADCEEKMGKLSDAMGHWVDARARAQTEGAAKIDEEASARAAALEPRLARLTIALAATAPNDAEVSRDGVVLGAPSLGIPLPLDPGPHTLIVKAKGRIDGASQVTLAEGENRRVELDAGPAAEHDAVQAQTKRSDATSSFGPLVIAGAAVAAAGLVVGSVTGLMALGAGSAAKTDCPNLQCSQKSFDDIQSGRTLGTVSTVSFVVAGAGAALAAYGLFLAPKSQPRVGVSVTSNELLLRGRF